MRLEKRYPRLFFIDSHSKKVHLKSNMKLTYSRVNKDKMTKNIKIVFIFVYDSIL